MNTNSQEMLQHNNGAPGRFAPPLALPGRPPQKRFTFNKLLLMAALAAVIGVFWTDVLSFQRFAPDVKKRDIPLVTQLHPLIARKQTELAAEAKNRGISILISDGFRSFEEQDALYRQGRSDGEHIVTNVKGGDSYHNYGLAIDFALRTKDGKVIWDLDFDGNHNGQSDWMEVVAIAKRLGFSWGGDWKSFPDYPHLQMDFGYSIYELKRGKRPPAENP